MAHAGVLLHRLTEQLMPGIEPSGQIARLSGFAEGYDAALYVGPSLGLEIGSEDSPGLEIGLIFLRRIDSGQAYRETVRSVVSAGF